MTLIDKNAIHLCRVYNPPKIKKGLWVLVDRLWPRGLKKEAINFDLWLKDIAPSPILRKWFHEKPKERWDEFVIQYINELHGKNALIEQFLNTVGEGSVTLFYAAKDMEHNHAIILKETLDSWPNLPGSRDLIE